jgi:hypothetical protein
MDLYTLSDLRVPLEEYKVNYAFFLKKNNFQNSKLLRWEIGKMTLFQELFHFSTTQGNMLANATNPTCVRNVLEQHFCKSYILGCYAHDCLYLCHGTVQIIRAQVQKQSPKWLNSHTWAHITPVVQRNHEGFQTNQHTSEDCSDST